jgi:AcrR family transcriptional regulator
LREKYYISRGCATLDVVARNAGRRAELADAGIAVLAREGSRGLTHRAVDAEGGAPTGTTSNYFRSRAELLEGLVARISERLAPDPEALAELASHPPDRASFGRHLRDIVRRLSAHPEVTLAWFELRLEAARRPELSGTVGAWLRTTFAADVEFNRQAGLPGGAAEVALFHYAIDGLLLDRLTTSIDAGTPTDEVLDRLVAGLLPPA